MRGKLDARVAAELAMQRDFGRPPCFLDLPPGSPEGRYALVEIQGTMCSERFQQGDVLLVERIAFHNRWPLSRGVYGVDRHGFVELLNLRPSLKRGNCGNFKGLKLNPTHVWLWPIGMPAREAEEFALDHIAVLWRLVDFASRRLSSGGKKATTTSAASPVTWQSS